MEFEIDRLGARWTTPFFSAAPYRFWPPGRAAAGVALTRRIARTFLDRAQGVRSIRLRGVRRVRESLAAGRAVMIAPNQNKYADPLVLAAVSGLALPPFHYMAARGDFEGNFSANGLLMQAAGAFSIDHSYNDLAALRTAVELLSDGARPLVVFPESLPYFNRDRVAPLFPGAGFIAFSAARTRARRGLPPLAIHPAATRYFYRRGLEERLVGHLTDLEHRSGLEPPAGGTEIEPRLRRLGEHLLERMERAHAVVAAAHRTSLADRLAGLLAAVFARLEGALGLSADSRHPLARARRIHRAAAAVVLDRNTPPAERARCRGLLSELDLVPRLARHWFAASPSPPACTDERTAQTVERLLDDVCALWTVAGPTDVVVRFGAVIDVDGRAPTAGRDPAAEAEFSDGLRAAMQVELDAVNSEDRPRGLRLM